TEELSGGGRVGSAPATRRLRRGGLGRRRGHRSLRRGRRRTRRALRILRLGKRLRLRRLGVSDEGEGRRQDRRGERRPHATIIGGGVRRGSRGRAARNPPRTGNV